MHTLAATDYLGAELGFVFLGDALQQLQRLQYRGVLTQRVHAAEDVPVETRTRRVIAVDSRNGLEQQGQMLVALPHSLRGHHAAMSEVLTRGDQIGRDCFRRETSLPVVQLVTGDQKGT